MPTTLRRAVILGLAVGLVLAALLLVFDPNTFDSGPEAELYDHLARTR